MKSITHIQLFLHSLLYPKRLAVYRILPIGKVIQYTFLLILLTTLLSIIDFSINGVQSINGLEQIDGYADDLQWLVYIVAILFSFTINTLVIYAKISFYAYVALLIGRVMQRKMEYRHIWRTAAFAITWEVVIMFIFTLVSIEHLAITTFVFLLSITITLIATSKYPKLKKLAI